MISFRDNSDRFHSISLSDRYIVSGNRKTCNVLEETSGYRSSWKGHSGITSEALYLDHAATLDHALHRLKDSVKDLFDRVQLVRPIKITFSNGVLRNQVEILTGSNPIFSKETIEGIDPLDASKLYLQIKDTGEMLELPPYFIMKNSPADVKNACYFYSRVEGGNSRYVSYHHEGKPEDTEAGDMVFSMIKAMLDS